MGDDRVGPLLSTDAESHARAAIMRDGQDPHLLANLTKLGQVAVPKPGTPYEKVNITGSPSPFANHLGAPPLDRPGSPHLAFALL